MNIQGSLYNIENCNMKTVYLVSAEEMKIHEELYISGDQEKSLQLMESAACAVVDVMIERCKHSKTAVILCGPGNNGGDGFAIARILSKQYKWIVYVYSYGALKSSDAKYMAGLYTGKIYDLSEDIALPHDAVIVDALFGTGLYKEINLPKLFDRLNSASNCIISVDIPSGVHGSTGEIMGCAIQADYTITFSVAKRGHFLLPGNALCGEVIIKDIGIPEQKSDFVLNTPDLWLNHMRFPSIFSHKYSRGSAFVYSSQSMISGSTILSMKAALRSLAGILHVSTSCARDSVCVIHTVSEAIPLQCTSIQDVLNAINEKKVTAVLIGPSSGKTLFVRELILELLATKIPLVMDADAISVFEGHVDILIPALHECVVLTPHEGEFRRIFPDLQDSRVSKIIESSRIVQSVILFKGNDTMIAHNGKVAINYNALPNLATAGSGDVLSGIIVGLLSTGMSAWHAASCAAWIHGRASYLFHSPSMIANDIINLLPDIFDHLYKLQNPRK